MADRISGVREIKLLNRYEKECAQFSIKKIKLLELEQKSDIIDMGNSSAETFIQGILTAIYYILGGYYACKGEMSLAHLKTDHLHPAGTVLIKSEAAYFFHCHFLL